MTRDAWFSPLRVLSCPRFFYPGKKCSHILAYSNCEIWKHGFDKVCLGLDFSLDVVSLSLFGLVFSIRILYIFKIKWCC